MLWIICSQQLRPIAIPTLQIPWLTSTLILKETTRRLRSSLLPTLHVCFIMPGGFKRSQLIFLVDIKLTGLLERTNAGQLLAVAYVDGPEKWRAAQPIRV